MSATSAVSGFRSPQDVLGALENAPRAAAGTAVRSAGGPTRGAAGAPPRAVAELFSARSNLPPDVTERLGRITNQSA